MEYCHYGYWDENFISESVEILKNRIKTYREVGIGSVGINVLCTRGHTEDGWEILPRADMQYEVGFGGNASKGILCVATPEFEEYISRKYGALATVGADFIWLDDDVRLGQCVCDFCVKSFNDAYGYSLTREELVSKIEKGILAAKWYQFQSKKMERLIKLIADSIKAVSPECEIGYMSIDPNAVPRWIESSRAVKGRPGGGFYDERTPIAVFDKCLSVQRQVGSYPKNVMDIQYEYEAFNYQTLDRSQRFTELESTLALMSGCNGVLYNNDIFYDRQPLIDMLRAYEKKWRVLIKKNEGMGSLGVYCTEPWVARKLLEIGIPVTFDLEYAVGCFILGDAWYGVHQDILPEILEKGVMTDGRGLEVLCERGCATHCGGRVKDSFASGMAERFTEHSLCGEYKGHYRDAFMNFTYYINNYGKAYSFERAEGAETVSRLETITHKAGECSLFIHDGDGRFAADGYLFINSINTHAKKAQLNAVIDWISRDKLPLKTPTTLKLMPIVRGDKNGNMTIMLTNASFDETGSFELEIRAGGQFYELLPNGTLHPLKQTESNGITTIILDNINGWGHAVVTNV